MVYHMMLSNIPSYIVTEYPFCISFLVLCWFPMLANAAYGWLILLATLSRRYIGHLHLIVIIHIHTALYRGIKRIINGKPLEPVFPFTNFGTSARRPTNNSIHSCSLRVCISFLSSPPPSSHIRRCPNASSWFMIRAWIVFNSIASFKKWKPGTWHFSPKSYHMMRGPIGYCHYIVTYI